MKKLLQSLLFSLLALPVIGQINLEDSTVQTIAFWDLNERNTYQFVLESFEVIEEDTAAWSKVSYQVEMTILDSTENSYEVLWEYQNFQLENDRQDSLYDQFIDKMMSITEGSTVQFKTNEYGVLQEVTNWEEIQRFYQQGSDTLKAMFGNIPELDAIVDQTFAIYMTKNSIESQSIKDVYQFLNFHGARYKLGEEVTGTTYARNILGQNRLKTEVTVLLDEIFAEDNDYRILSFMEADSDQLLKETELVIKAMIPDATDEQMVELMQQVGNPFNTVETVSIIHGWGWPLYSKEEKITGSAQQTKVEIRTLELL